jgi:hypothetical protein
MMIWCELHHSTTLKAGITNFDMSEYEKDIPLLNTMSQVLLSAILFPTIFPTILPAFFPQCAKARNWQTKEQAARLTLYHRNLSLQGDLTRPLRNDDRLKLSLLIFFFSVPTS